MGEQSWAKLLLSTAAETMREAVLFALCTLSLVAAVRLWERVIVTLFFFSSALLIEASVVIESTEGATDKNFCCFL